MLKRVWGEKFELISYRKTSISSSNPFAFLQYFPACCKTPPNCGPRYFPKFIFKCDTIIPSSGKPTSPPLWGLAGSPRATWTPSRSLRDRCRVLVLSLRYIPLVFAIQSFGFLNPIWGWGTWYLDVVGKIADRFNFLHLAGSSRRLYWMRLSIGHGFLLAV